MKNKTLLILSSVVLAAITLSSCEAIGGIFKAGMWTGVIVVVLVVAVVIFIISKLFFKKRVTAAAIYYYTDEWDFSFGK